MGFLDRARTYISERLQVGEGYALLRACVADGGADALKTVRLLAEDAYGGERYAFDRKMPSAFALCTWGRRGLDELVDLGTRANGSDNMSLCLSVLASVAAGGSGRLKHLAGDEALAAAVLAATDSAEMRSEAQARLSSLMSRVPSDAEVIAAVVRQFRPEVEDADLTSTHEICLALAARWVTVNDAALERLQSLIETSPRSRRAMLHLLDTHPRVIDPGAMTIWRDPAPVERSRPDFVIRRTDESYLLAEVRTPGEAIMARDGHLSRAALNARARLMSYMDRLARHSGASRYVLPDLGEPNGLVLIGLERSLSTDERDALYRANASCRRVRVVGYDSLLQRSDTIARNMRALLWKREPVGARGRPDDAE
jgi:hypothetical protein